ncbi:MAG: polyketide cyclase / dehydrase and lipid transport [Actinomycetes bacterium]
MTLVDLVDDTFVVADPARVAALVDDPACWRRWWPDLTLTPSERRGPKGVRWTVSGPLVGTSEIWLEPYADGVLVHYYLRADPVAGVPTSASARRRLAARLRRRHALAWKRTVHALKDDLEAARRPGEPRAD